MFCFGTKRETVWLVHWHPGHSNVHKTLKEPWSITIVGTLFGRYVHIFFDNLTSMGKEMYVLMYDVSI